MQLNQGRSIVILIVEDDPESRQVLDFGLRSYGYKVATAGNGAEGLEILVGQRVDVVLTDLLMPVMDGLDLAVELKASPLTSEIPIVFMSDRKLEATFDEHSVFAAMLTKPFSLDELTGVLERFNGGAKAA